MTVKRNISKMLSDVISEAIENGADIQFAPFMANDPDGPCVFMADWNETRVWDDPTTCSKNLSTHNKPNATSRIGALLERCEGVLVEWCDTTSVCDECMGAIETEPDSYGWKPQFVIRDSGYTCKSCVLDDIDEYETWLMNNTHKTDMFGVDWAARGWRLHPERGGALPEHTDFILAEGLTWQRPEYVRHLDEDERDALYSITNKTDADREMALYWYITEYHADHHESLKSITYEPGIIRSGDDMDGCPIYKALVKV